MTKHIGLTGATQGIGLACARKLLCDDDVHLIVLARDPARVRQLFGDRATAIPCDLASLADVRRATAEVVHLFKDGRISPLSALMLNAGMQTASGPLQYTVDGIETVFATNHLAHFLIANALFGSLSERARVVFTASGTHDPDTMDGRFNKPLFTTADELAYPETTGAPRMSHLQRYATSKLCNIYTAYEMARRVARLPQGAGAGITVNAFDPGAVPGTGLLRQHGRIAKALFGSPLVRLLTRVESIDDAGAALARLVQDPGLSGVTGAYFAGTRQRRSSVASYDLDQASALWTDSWRLVGLADDANRLAPSALTQHA